jgi:hypothetical protein
VTRLKDNEEGVRSFLQTKRRGRVSLLILKVDLELHLRQQNNFDLKHVNCCLTSLCHYKACFERGCIGCTCATKESILVS